MVTVLPALDRVDEPWRNGGGSTRQVAALAGPHGIDWRLSMARVDADGPFSVFPDTTRTIMVMDGGEMSLNVAGTEVRIGQEPYTFDGAATTHGALRGSAVTDFNVMVRRGRYGASTERLAGRSAFTVPSAVTAQPCTVVVVAPSAGAHLQIEELDLDLQLGAYDAVMIDRVTAPLNGIIASAGSAVTVALTPDRGLRRP